MGTFPGHALPGSFFCILSLWWTIQMFNRYYSARHRNSRFTSSAIFKCACLGDRLKDLPIEAYVKLVFATVGFILEIRTGIIFSEGHLVNPGNGQHATMFFYFGFTGVVDLLLHHKVPLPPDMDYISMAMAFLCEFVLFRFHLHGRSDLDVLLHTLLLYLIGAAIISVILEMRNKNNFLYALMRAYFALYQGTWFWQVGWILYPPFKNSAHWDGEDHVQMMVATMFFAWHGIGNLFVILFIGGLIAFLHRRFSGYSAEDGMSMKRLIHTSSNGDRTVRLNIDSDSETEFEKPMLS